MHKHIARGIAAVVAGAALSAAGASGAGPPGTAAAATAAQVARAGSAGTSPGAAASGTRLWIAHYIGPPGTGSQVSSMAVSPDGTRVFVTGSSAKAGTRLRFATAGYKTATSARLWSRRYIGPGSYMSRPRSVAVSPDGSTVYVTGTINSMQGGEYWATIAYRAATGTTAWIARYDGPGPPSSEVANAVAVSPNGRTVFVTGSGSTTIAYRAATGARLWIAQYRYDLNGGSVAVAVSPGGGKVIVTGSNQLNEYVTLAYRSADGTRLWARHHGGPTGFRDYGGATALTFSPNGSTVFVTGDDHGSLDSGVTYATIAYRATDGTQLWDISDSPLAGRGGASAVAVSPDGRTVLVTGNDYVTVAYRAATGAQLWATPRLDANGPGPGAQLRASRSRGGYATTLAVSPDGRKVFVTGLAYDPNPIPGFTTVAYGTATGARLWFDRYQGPRHLGATGVVVAVSPDGRRVYVAGNTSWAPPHSPGSRMTVIAYRA